MEYKVVTPKRSYRPGRGDRDEATYLETENTKHEVDFKLLSLLLSLYTPWGIYMGDDTDL